MSNFTVDDTDGSLSYGPGWGISSANDPSLAEYFQSTYHASQSVGAAVNLTFSGSVIYLYGSTGPAHASYSVRCDGTVQLMSALSMDPQYRQLLFSSQLPFGTHSLTLNNTNGLWLDLDSVTVTAGNSTSTINFSSTIAPVVLPTSSISSIPSPSSSNVSSQTMSPTATIHMATFVLAIVFGVLLFCAMIAGVWFYTRYRNNLSLKPARQPPPPPADVRLPGSAFLTSQEVVWSPPSSPPAQMTSAQAGVMSDEAGPSPSTDTHSHPPTAFRPWSPFSGPLKHVFGNAKSDGTDSMKSTFLKV